MREEIQNVLNWGKARGLHVENLQPQLVKLTEELGEVAAGVARQDMSRVVDGVGDLLVVLINFGACFAKINSPVDQIEQERLAQNFLDMCLATAWHEIANRKGRTENGVFIKEEA